MSGDVRIVFRTTTTLTPDDVSAAAALLSDEERERYRQFRFADDARDYAAAHALLRTELSRGCGTAPSAWRFDRNTNGKPFLADGAPNDPTFSLSHTRGLVACAIGPGDVPLGVDVESEERDVDVDRLAARFFAAAEVELLAALPARARRERFVDLWMLKEAAVKALGLAVPAALKTFTFSIESADRASIVRCDAPTLTAGEWQFALFRPAAGYRAAVAACRQAATPPLTIRWLPFTPE
jgi:4'-phosphopantetheinyl transferase